MVHETRRHTCDIPTPKCKTKQNKKQRPAYSTTDPRPAAGITAQKNCETDPNVNINTDHYPLTMTIRIKLKSQKKETRINRPKYDKATEEQRNHYDAELKRKLAELKPAIKNTQTHQTAKDPAPDGEVQTGLETTENHDTTDWSDPDTEKEILDLVYELGAQSLPERKAKENKRG